MGNPLKAITGLVKAAAVNWVKDYAQSMGAALAFYTIFSIAPLLLIVIAIAGAVFGEEAARGEIYGQLQGMLGSHGAAAVQGLLESVGERSESVPAAAFGVVVLFIGATSVFAELQDALDRIWRAPQRPSESGPVEPGARAAAVLRHDPGHRLPAHGVAGRHAAAESLIGGGTRNRPAGATFTGVDWLSAGRPPDGVFAMIYKPMPRGPRLARCLGGCGVTTARSSRSGAASGSTSAERHHHGFGAAARSRSSAVGVLLGADFPVRRRVHLGLFTPVRLAPRAAAARAQLQRVRAGLGRIS